MQSSRSGADDRPHIVIVEDEAAQRQLLVDYLSQQNVRVTGVQRPFS
jgi:DNA-binding response OmpR family regulator